MFAKDLQPQCSKVAVVHYGTRGVHPLFARYPHSLSRHGPVSQSALQNAILLRIKMQLPWKSTNHHFQNLGGGFKYFLFSTLFGEDVQFD